MHYEYPQVFNTTLTALKAKYAAGPHSSVWARIVSDTQLEGGLLTKKDSDESSVDEAEAAAFWTGDSNAGGGSPRRLAGETQLDDDDDDALDGLE